MRAAEFGGVFLKIHTSLVALVLISSCSSGGALRTQTDTERLRSHISKVRVASQETRSVISRSRGALHEAELWMRLADLLRDEARSVYELASVRDGGHDAVYVPQVRVLRNQAITAYERVLQEHPTSEHCARALFSIALVQLGMGMVEAVSGEENDRVSPLDRLVEEDRFRSSPYRSAALLLLGDLAFERSQQDEAAAFYHQILDDEGGQLHDLACYKLAWVSLNRGDCARALPFFERAFELSRGEVENELRRTLIEDLQVLDVQREALVDSISCLSVVRPREPIIPYIRSRVSEREAYVVALEAAARAYSRAGESAAVATITRELLTVDPHREGRLDDARQLHEAVVSSGDFSKAATDIHLIINAMGATEFEHGTTSFSRKKLSAELEMRTRDIAQRAHHASILTKNEKGAYGAALAYIEHLQAFPETRMRRALTEKLARAFGLAGRWSDAGQYFQAAANMTTDVTGKASAHCDATIAYRKVFDSEPSSQRSDRLRSLSGIRESGASCLKMPSIPRDKAAEIRFVIAESYALEGNATKANDLMTALAHEFPDSPTAHRAVESVIKSSLDAGYYTEAVVVGQRFLSSKSPFSDEIKRAIRRMIGIVADQGIEEPCHGEPPRLDPDNGHWKAPIRRDCSKRTAIMKQYQGSPEAEVVFQQLVYECRLDEDATGLYEVAEEFARRFPPSAKRVGVLSMTSRVAAERFELDKALHFIGLIRHVNGDDRARFFIAEGELREAIADYQGAEKAYMGALESAMNPEMLRKSAMLLADVLERRGRGSKVIAALGPIAKRAGVHAEIPARLALAELRAGRRDDARGHLMQALDVVNSSSRAVAMSTYGFAELNLGQIEGFNPGDTIDNIEELLDLIDQAESDYLITIRQGAIGYSFAAFSRVSRVYEVASAKLSKCTWSGLSQEETREIDAAIQARSRTLLSQSREALAACAERVKQIHRYDRGARSCLTGAPAARDPFPDMSTFRPNKRAKLHNVEELRRRIRMNPDNVDALEKLGTAALVAGDNLLARLVFNRAVESGGGPETANMLGVASVRAGDIAGALEAFSQATSGGHKSAPYNMAAVAKSVGLDQLAREFLSKAPSDPDPNALLPSARPLVKGRRP